MHLPRRHKKVKVGYTITFKSVERLPKAVKDHPVKVRWQGGWKPLVKGDSEAVTVIAGDAPTLFENSVLRFTARLKQEKHHEFKSKLLVVSVVAENIKGKKEVVVGLKPIDLAKFSKPGEFNTEQSIFLQTKRGKDGPKLSFKIEAEWRSVGGKKVVKGHKKHKRRSKVTESVADDDVKKDPSVPSISLVDAGDSTNPFDENPDFKGDKPKKKPRKSRHSTGGNTEEEMSENTVTDGFQIDGEDYHLVTEIDGFSETEITNSDVDINVEEDLYLSEEDEANHMPEINEMETSGGLTARSAVVDSESVGSLAEEITRVKDDKSRLQRKLAVLEEALKTKNSELKLAQIQTAGDAKYIEEQKENIKKLQSQLNDKSSTKTKVSKVQAQLTEVKDELRAAQLENKLLTHKLTDAKKELHSVSVSKQSARNLNVNLEEKDSIILSLTRQLKTKDKSEAALKKDLEEARDQASYMKEGLEAAERRHRKMAAEGASQELKKLKAQLSDTETTSAVDRELMAMSRDRPVLVQCIADNPSISNPHIAHFFASLQYVYANASTQSVSIIARLLSWLIDVHDSAVTDPHDAISKKGIKLLFESSVDAKNKEAWTLENGAFLTVLSAHINAIYAHLCDAAFRSLQKGSDSISNAIFSAQLGEASKDKFQLKDLLNDLTSIHKTLMSLQLPNCIVLHIMAQVVYGVNVNVFNALIRGQVVCTAGVGFAIKMAMSQLEEWAAKCNAKLVPYVRRGFDLCSQAANVLVIDKSIFASDDVMNDIFPGITKEQIGLLLENFHPDQFAPDAVPDVVLNMYPPRGGISSNQLDTTILVPL